MTAVKHFAVAGFAIAAWPLVVLGLKSLFGGRSDMLVTSGLGAIPLGFVVCLGTLIAALIHQQRRQLVPQILMCIVGMIATAAMGALIVLLIAGLGGMRC
jgi:hypothetical protein